MTYIYRTHVRLQQRQRCFIEYPEEVIFSGHGGSPRKTGGSFKSLGRRCLGD